MYVQDNSVLNVTEKDGRDIQFAVLLQKKLFGYAAKNVYLPSLCVDFHMKTLINLIEKGCLFIEMEAILLSVSIVLDTFQALGLKILKDTFQSVKKKNADLNFNQTIEMCNTVEIYKNVINQTFCDKKYNFGRMYVITLFTEKVCQNNPQIACDVKELYLDFIKKIK
jgi:hypothetical protein